MRNIALNKPATQSSTSEWSTHRDRELDASVATNDQLPRDAYFHTGVEDRPWWQVDLGSPFAITGMKILNRLDCRDRLRDFSILRSLDGVTWFGYAVRKAEAEFDDISILNPTPVVSRYIRVRLEDVGALHFRQIQIFGAEATAEAISLQSKQDADVENFKNTIDQSRVGKVEKIGGFDLFIDDAYGENVKFALLSGQYEDQERILARKFLRRGDRVLEIGTAVGLVTMTAASVVGETNVVTFDGNPYISQHAKANFIRNGLEGIQNRVGLLANRNNFVADTFADFHISREFWASRIDADDKSDIIEVAKIPRVCLEQEIADFGANVLICDIEGGEVDLLKDADLSAIDLIIIETHYWARGEQATDEMVAHLIASGLFIHLWESGRQVSLFRRASRM